MKGYAGVGILGLPQEIVATYSDRHIGQMDRRVLAGIIISLDSLQYYSVDNLSVAFSYN